MPRKRRYGITSAMRYQLKAYRVHKIDGIPEDLANLVALNQTMAWSTGFGMFHRVWENVVKRVLQELKVGKIYWGLYRAFTCQVLSKTVEKKTEEIDLVIRKFANLGLDIDVLRAIVNAIQQAEIGLIPATHEESSEVSGAGGGAGGV